MLRDRRLLIELLTPLNQPKVALRTSSEYSNYRASENARSGFVVQNDPRWPVSAWHR